MREIPKREDYNHPELEGIVKQPDYSLALDEMRIYGWLGLFIMGYGFYRGFRR